MSRCNYPECAGELLLLCSSWRCTKGWGSGWGNKQALRGDKMWDLSHYTEQEILKGSHKLAQHSCTPRAIVWINTWRMDRACDATRTRTSSYLHILTASSHFALEHSSSAGIRAPVSLGCRHVRPRKPPNTVMFYFMEHQPSLPPNSPSLLSLPLFALALLSAFSLSDHKIKGLVAWESIPLSPA